ncbi:PREDICTED: uncharacterized protein LOC109151107 [Ipomoea nil]|uniref:uncharacterized protein LOC109151107 n=1 Tax=Ipomoea nil TaxID=35883 RepID=UPI0009015ECD|nr:PREDICTED: uncharacterized protein LOC109151107 [Ipomoea nil]
MERVSLLKLACFLVLFMAALSLLPSSLMAKIYVGPNKVELFMTGQLCKSHSDCKTNTAYPGNFCINQISGSEIGHCVGFGSTLALPSERKDEERKPNVGYCGKCETDEDCRNCSVTAGCEKIIVPGYCM